MDSRHTFEVEQDGVIVASGEAPDYETAMREGFHYARQYAVDGPVHMRVKEVRRRKPKPTHPTTGGEGK